jgi:hypothetical protein
MKKIRTKEQLGVNISYPQVRQQWFSVGIFPLVPSFGLTGNRPQSAPACSFLALAATHWRFANINLLHKKQTLKKQKTKSKKH